MKKIITTLIFSTLLISIASAEVGNTVSHSHENRVHTHPLPSIGINHNHNANKQNKKRSLKWILLASTDEKYTNEYYGKPKSLRVNDNIASIVGKVYNTLTNKINVYKWSISISHCDNEMGVVKYHSIDGSYLTKTEFVFDSGNVISIIAKEICNAVN